MYIINNKERKAREKLIEFTMKYFDTHKYLPISAMLTHLQIGQARRKRKCYYTRAPFSAIQKCFIENREKYLDFIEKCPKAELQMKIDYVRDLCLPQLKQYYHECDNYTPESETANEAELEDGTEQVFDKEKIEDISESTVRVSDDTYDKFTPKQEENYSENLEVDDTYSWLPDVSEVEGDFSEIETFLLDEVGYDKLSASFKAQLDDMANECGSDYEEILEVIKLQKDKLEELIDREINPSSKASLIVQGIKKGILSIRAQEQEDKEDSEAEKGVISVGGENAEQSVSVQPML